MEADMYATEYQDSIEWAMLEISTNVLVPWLIQLALIRGFSKQRGCKKCASGLRGPSHG